MKNLFIAVSIFAFSLVVIRILQNIVDKSNRISSMLKKYQTRVILSITIITVLMPFILLLILGDTITFENIVKIFLASLLASAIFGLFVEHVRNSVFSNTFKMEKRNAELLGVQTIHGYEFDWKTNIEIETLERFGLNSTVGISFNSLDRLGSQFSELVMLEREIDALDPSSIRQE